MALIGYPHSFLNGLSDFWQRFFADAPQLDALYQGTAVLVGQAYLDLLTNVLGVSLKDTPIYAKNFYKLITFREDELAFDVGLSSDDDRWVATLPDNVVSFLSLDNRVIEPTAALQERSDYDIDRDTKTVRFKVDPTDPNEDGTPLAGFARRALDVGVGGSFDDTTRPIGTSWMSRNVRKGDTLRLLDIGPDLVSQRKRTDHPIVLVREKTFYVSSATPLTETADPQSYVVLRQPADNEVTNEAMTFGGDEAVLVHNRIDYGSVRVYAKNLAGEDAVEDVDYTVDYERGRLYKKASWNVTSSNLIDYTWQAEVWPNSGGSPPRYATTGVIRAGAATARVVQMAMWAPDAYVDHRTLANNFGALIGREEDSSENYRAFLRGIFQLYLLGPVLERIESAINVIVGFPVIRDDGEILVNVDTTSDPLVNYVTTRRATNNVTNVYEFPKSVPLRTDLVPANYETLTFEAFEPLTTAVTVTDYIQSPDWWHNIVIPAELFSTSNGATVPIAPRRTVNPAYVQHLVGAPITCVGDPGLLVGADEEGFEPAPGHPIFRHRLAYVLMDRFFKYHTFIVRFDPTIFSLTEIGYARTYNDLVDLVLSSKPAHTYVVTQPLTDFIDTFIGADGDYWYQPASVTSDPDQPEFYLTEGAIPEPLQPYTQLGLFFNFAVASPPGGADQVLFTDAAMIVGETPMLVGDFFHYEENLADPYNFPTIGVPVVVGGAPPANITYRAIRVFINTTIGGRALVENVDYTVDYGAMSITRLTAWDDITLVAVSYVFLAVGNVSTSAANPAIGDTQLSVGMTDPSTVTADFDPTDVNWMGEAQPVTNHQDLGLVDRPLQLTVI